MVNDIMSVSYTHLDVYKRQAQVHAVHVQSFIMTGAKSMAAAVLIVQ